MQPHVRIPPDCQRGRRMPREFLRHLHRRAAVHNPRDVRVAQRMEVSETTCGILIPEEVGRLALLPVCRRVRLVYPRRPCCL